MMRMRIAVAAIAALLLASCAWHTPRPGRTGSHNETQHPQSRRYSQRDDSGPATPPIDVNKISEPVPKNEPHSRYGNPESYTVLGQAYRVMPDARGYVERGIASWYGNKFHGYMTSSLEPYNMYAFTAAHKTLPLPSYARVTNLENGKSVTVRINDRGPFSEKRIIDLSYAAAVKIGVWPKGTSLVEVRVIDPAHPDLPVTRTAAADDSAHPKLLATRTAVVDDSAHPDLPVTRTAAVDDSAHPKLLATRSVAASDPARPDLPVTRTVAASDPTRPDLPVTRTAAASDPTRPDLPVTRTAAVDDSAHPNLLATRTVAADPPAAAVSQAPPVVSSAASTAPRIYLQIGSFNERGNAERAAASVMRAGLDHVDIQSSVAVDGHTIHRVRIGPVADVDTADAMVSRIEKLGLGSPHVAIEH
jgi:rare lipoprotein A